MIARNTWRHTGSLSAAALLLIALAGCESPALMANRPEDRTQTARPPANLEPPQWPANSEIGTSNAPAASEGAAPPALGGNGPAGLARVPLGEPGIIDAAREVTPSVVAVRPANRDGLGSGVIVSRNGYILTNNHVVRGT
ncbi:MAG TPA: hypothetical protein VFU47_10445, partial [Armatimonadota bacterium]|nr:hypothetical protein [Armatimonadota bacterium]